MLISSIINLLPYLAFPQNACGYKYFIHFRKVIILLKQNTLWFYFKFKSHPVTEKQYLKVRTHNMDKHAEMLKGSCFKEPKDWKLFVQGIPQRKCIKSKTKNIKKLNSDFFSLQK